MSIGSVGFSMENNRTTSAVFGPTCGSAIRFFRAFSTDISAISSNLHLSSSRIFLATCFIALALFLYSPPTFRHSESVFTSALAIAFGVIQNWFERLLKAFAEFLSLVF